MGPGKKKLLNWSICKYGFVQRTIQALRGIQGSDYLIIP